MTLKGTETERNLLISFVAESQASSLYLVYAKTAKTEGYAHIHDAFVETAEHERQHAKKFLEFLNQYGAALEAEFTWSFSTGPLASTEENLRAAAADEHQESSDVYPRFAEVAERESFGDIAFAWRAIARAEEWHHRRFIKLAENIEKGWVFKRDEKVEWSCIKCGYMHEGKRAPDKCPACGHSQAHFMLHVLDF